MNDQYELTVSGAVVTLKFLRGDVCQQTKATALHEAHRQAKQRAGIVVVEQFQEPAGPPRLQQGLDGRQIHRGKARLEQLPNGQRARDDGPQPSRNTWENER